MTMLLCCAQLLSHVQLFTTSWIIAHQAPPSMGILKARILEWVAYPFSRESSQPRNQTGVSSITGGFFLPAELPGKPQSMTIHAKSLQSCLTLCDFMDCSLPGSSIHGDSPGKNTGVGSLSLLQGILLTQGSNRRH